MNFKCLNSRISKHQWLCSSSSVPRGWGSWRLGPGRWWFPESGLLCPLGMKEDQIWWCWFQPEAHHHLQLEAVDEFCRLDSHHPSSAVTPALPPERDSLCLFHQRFSNYKNSTQALSCKHLHEIFFSYRHLKGKYSFTIDAETPMRDFLFDFVQRDLFFLSSWFERLQTSLCSTAHFNEQLWIFLRNTFAVTGYKIWLLGISQESGSFAALRLIWQGWARAPCLSTGCTSDLEDKHGVEAEDTHTHKHTQLCPLRCWWVPLLSYKHKTRGTAQRTRVEHFTLEVLAELSSLSTFSLSVTWLVTPSVALPPAAARSPTQAEHGGFVCR